MRGYEPTLSDLITAAWRARGPITIGAACGLALAVILTFVLTPYFKATMIVAPADGYALGDYASSVAEGKGMSIPFWRPREADDVSTDFHRFVYTAKGPAAAAVLLKDPSVTEGLSKDGRWPARREPWTPEALAAYLDKNIRIEHLGATPLRRLSYRHPDPAFAAALLRKLHLVADQMIRRDRRRQSEARIAYLQDQLIDTVNPDHRRGIADLLTQQEHVKMLANLDEPYAAIVVEPPAASAKPVWPNGMLLIAVMMMLGGGCGYVAYAIRKRNAPNDFVH